MNLEEHVKKLKNQLVELKSFLEDSSFEKIINDYLSKLRPDISPADLEKILVLLMIDLCFDEDREGRFLQTMRGVCFYQSHFDKGYKYLKSLHDQVSELRIMIRASRTRTPYSL